MKNTHKHTHTKTQRRVICVGSRKHKDEIKLAKTQAELDLTQNINTLRKEERLTQNEERHQIANIAADTKNICLTSTEEALLGFS